MPSTVFECPTPKCAYVIDSEGLNAIQLVLDNSRRIKLGSRMGVSPQDENTFAPGVIYLDLLFGKALRMWAKTCPRCQHLGHFVEKLPLLDTKTLKEIGGSKNAIPNQTIPKSKGQKRRAAGYNGH